MVAPIDLGKEALCESDISHFHGRLRDRKSGTGWMGRGCDAGERTLGNVRRLSLDDHLGDGVGRSSTGASATSRPGARRTAFGLGIPDLWNASLRLPLATPGLAKSTRKPTAAPRVVVGADRVECASFTSVGHGSKGTTEIWSRSAPTSWRIRPLALSGCSRRPRLDAGQDLTSLQKEKH